MRDLVITLKGTEETMTPGRPAHVFVLSNEKGACVAKVFADNSRVALSGAKWMLGAAEKDFGKRALLDGFAAARMDGRAMLTR